ncbi:MAG TPA: TRAP transporter small permease subunit [Bacillota bacterium]|jgi:TRAP-type C4-dicarboxylate transport system permease small subunit|nr:TRAP transporter small permease subunit [Bacillota bacterium]
MGKLKKAVDKISLIERNFCGLTLFVMIALNFIEISRRIILVKSFPWVQEITVMMFCWLVYIGVAYIFSASNLLNVDFLYAKARGRVKLIWDIAMQLIILCVLTGLAVYGWKFAIVQGSARTYALNLPNSLYSIPLVISSFSMMLASVVKIHAAISQYRDYRAGEEGSL